MKCGYFITSGFVIITRLIPVFIRETIITNIPLVQHQTAIFFTAIVVDVGRQLSREWTQEAASAAISYDILFRSHVLVHFCVAEFFCLQAAEDIGRHLTWNTRWDRSQESDTGVTDIIVVVLAWIHVERLLIRSWF
jgi:hypothetical protein